MGIAPYKYFTFDGESSRNYDVYLTGTGVFNAPQRAVDLLEIPGRNGNYALDQGRFNNITVTYKAGIVDYSESDFADKVSAVRNWLCSKVGYVRLTDDYNPDEYRMAVFKNGITVDHDDLKTGEFDITFECKPQRWLTSGETPIEIGAWGDTQTVSGDIVQFNALETDKVKSLVADIDPIQDLHGYDAPWVAGGGKNILPCPYSETRDTISTVSVTQYTDGKIKLNGTVSGGTLFFNFGTSSLNVLTLEAGSYIVSGGTSTFKIVAAKDGAYYGTTSTTNGTLAITLTEQANIYFYGTANNGSSFSNVVISPMLEVGSSPTSWQPYSNICPISGWSGVGVSVVGKNLLDPTNAFGSFSGYTVNADGSVTVTEADSRAWTGIAPIPLKAGTYTLSRDTVVGRTAIRKSDDNYSTDTIIFANNTSVTFTLANDGGIKIKANYSGTYPITIKFQLELGSPATTYEPYNGTTYTVSWSGDAGTVYGGTVDVVSGELTVTHAIVDMGDLNWVYSTGQNNYFYSSTISGFKYVSDTTVNYLCSCYDSYSVSERYQNGKLFINSGKNAIVMDTQYTDAGTFKTSVTGQKIVYELATPTTYTLTAQQVDLLLVGQNTVFADTGDVTVEYGQDPMVLINPTPFEAEPLLAVKGYGTIDFNGYEVEINNVTIGDVVVINDDVPQRDIYVGKHPTYVIDTSMLNNGDTVTVDIDMYCTTTASSLTKTNIGTKASQPSPTDSNSAFLSTQNRNKTNTHGTFSFPLGTDYSITNTVTGTMNWQHSLPSVDFTISYSYTQAITYDSATDKIQIEFTLSATSSDVNITPVTTGGDSKVVTKVYAIGDSTKSGLGDPTYIDCDIGECYMVDDGQIVTLNDTVILGSDLPKLSSGANTFTMDGTVTELKVTPRWWKV